MSDCLSRMRWMTGPSSGRAAGSVVWAPKIAGPIDGQVIQLSGDDLTAEQATKIADALRDAT